MAAKRELDIVVLGATGYTGKLVAEYITQNLPTNIRWAVAGRSESKLNSLLSDLKTLNSTRSPPTVLTVSGLTAPEVSQIAKKTQVLINAVGPYHLYSTPVVKACADTGTHYLDSTGETPWIHDLIVDHEAAAKSSGAIIINSIGIESTPSDIIAYKAAQLIRNVWDCGVMDMVGAIHELKSSGASGGTLSSGLSLFDSYSAAQMRKVFADPFSLSPSHLRPYTKETIYPRSPEPGTYSRTGLQKFSGVWDFPRLGTLTTSISAKPNVAIVHRSAGLTPLFYGFNFSYEEYMAVSSPISGVIVHFALLILTFLIAFPLTRPIVKALAPYKPGAGPAADAGKNDAFEIRGIAVAEQLAKVPRKAFVSFRHEGSSMYALTALLLSEAALVLLNPKAQEEVKTKHGVGFLTPSCLGDAYVDRLTNAGIKINVKQIGDVGSK